jgi:hypothetical protein
MTDKPTLNDIAPYPEDLTEVTAKGMAKHFAANALVNHRLRLKLDPFDDGRAWRIALRDADYGRDVSMLLRKLVEHAGAGVADAVARRLWAERNDGDDEATDLKEWLAGDGIDCGVLEEMAQFAYGQAQKLKTYVPPASPEVHPDQTTIPAGGAS